MEAVREVTVWDVDYRQPNHIYLLDGDRIKACINWGEGPVEWLSGRMKIDRRGRKFEKVDLSLFDVKEEKDPVILEVPGSKGVTYYVNVEDKTCTCPGFTFRSTCKHTKELV
jgi:hypothetical protein